MDGIGLVASGDCIVGVSATDRPIADVARKIVPTARLRHRRGEGQAPELASPELLPDDLEELRHRPLIYTIRRSELKAQTEWGGQLVGNYYWRQACRPDAANHRPQRLEQRSRTGSSPPAHPLVRGAARASTLHAKSAARSSPSRNWSSRSSSSRTVAAGWTNTTSTSGASRPGSSSAAS